MCKCLFRAHIVQGVAVCPTHAVTAVQHPVPRRRTLSASRRLTMDAMRPKQKDRKKPPMTMVNMHQI